MHAGATPLPLASAGEQRDLRFSDTTTDTPTQQPLRGPLGQRPHAGHEQGHRGLHGAHERPPRRGCHHRHQRCRECAACTGVAKRTSSSSLCAAQPLDKAHAERIEKALKGSAAAAKGKSLKVNYKVSAAIQGGLQVDFGDRSVDLSVQSRVQKLNAL